jgi:hypothetical protein
MRVKTDMSRPQLKNYEEEVGSDKEEKEMRLITRQVIRMLVKKRYQKCRKISGSSLCHL